MPPSPFPWVPVGLRKTLALRLGHPGRGQSREPWLFPRGLSTGQWEARGGTQEGGWDVSPAGGGGWLMQVAEKEGLKTALKSASPRDPHPGGGRQGGAGVGNRLGSRELDFGKVPAGH